ncbi:Type IV fimbrial assembly, ATPase PilB [hydrothermal vent metagenome]|uniref:Type IV fimbrial assembly, ATPase PilB n=1 Tax=hydrothermal vent metagenome TaxID=652676 RepID=A0A3B1BBG7_9ZZZZ
MATTKPKVNLSGLARCLIMNNLLNEQEAEKAFQEAIKKRIPFVAHLVENKLLKSREIAETASMEFGVPFFDLDALDTESAPIDLVEEKLLRSHSALPLVKRGNRLFLAVSDPTNHQGLDEIKFNTGLASEAVLVEEDKLKRHIEKALDAQDTSMSDMMDADLDNLDIIAGDEDGGAASDNDAEIDEAPVVRFVNKILLDAINSGVSDIHIEPYEKILRIRYRQDGILREVASPPPSIGNRMTARIKVMSRMNIAERRVPQDGRIRMKLSKTRAIDFRVSTCPVLHGEKIVLRILDPANSEVPLDALGLDEKQTNDFLKAIKKPYGMVLITGPTGSGKTVTLYTGLNILNTPDINISTAEDPVEVTVDGINQVNENSATGMTFAVALKAFLRQDPDIIMVGEIRDQGTAEIAVKAAQTGHLVLSTLHTNDAPQTLTRMVNMGIPPFNISSAVILIMAQRLARRLCKHCKIEEDLPEEALLEEGFTAEEIPGLTLYKAGECDKCTKGYKGRLGIFQVMPLSEAMGRMVMEGGNAMELADLAASEGINDLRRSGLNKVSEGLTSLEELNRVTKE